MPDRRAPPPHTALAALPVVVLDLETTGFDPKRDRIVQVAAVGMLGTHILDSPRVDQLIDPGMPIPASATRIHGLSDKDVAGAPKFGEFLSRLLDTLSERIVVGHQIAFDLAMLRHEAARAGIAWSDPPALDLALLIGALHPSLPSPSLEITASLLGVTIERRHTAWGDAMAAADAFAQLIPRLRDAGIRTLGEAQVLATRRADLVMRQVEAGWHVAALEPPGDEAQSPPARIDSYVFERHIGEVMSAPPVMIEAGATLREAARLMTERRIGALLVKALDEPPLGIITERDLMRAMAQESLDPDAATIQQIMTTDLESMAAGEMLYRALGRMDRKQIRHLCVVDSAGAPVGIISQRDLLRHRTRSAVALEDAIASAKNVPALAAAYGQLPDVAARLLAEGLNGVNVARVISNELRALTARVAQIASERLRAARGEAPAPWCLLVLGSGGRGESLLAADQDNALIYAGDAKDDGWFSELGTMVAEILDEAGLPRCGGGVMAANPEWRGNMEIWRERVKGWLRRARPEDLLYVDIFFDLAPVAGNASLAEALEREAVHAATRTRTFVPLLAESVAGLKPPLGLFGRLQTEAGRVDLKLGGLLPLVSIARTLALRIGSTSRSTPDRLRDVVVAARLAEADAAVLLEIHANLMTLVLRQQIKDLAKGVRPSARVPVKELDRETVRRLKRDLRRLDEILATLRAAVSG